MTFQRMPSDFAVSFVTKFSVFRPLSLLRGFKRLKSFQYPILYSWNKFKSIRMFRESLRLLSLQTDLRKIHIFLICRLRFDETVVSARALWGIFRSQFPCGWSLHFVKWAAHSATLQTSGRRVRSAVTLTATPAARTRPERSEGPRTLVRRAARIAIPGRTAKSLQHGLSKEL